MRRAQITYLLTLSGLLFFALGAFTAWSILNYAQSGSINRWLLILLLVLIAAVGFWLYRFIGTYLFAVKALSDDARLILNANPQHRVTDNRGSNHTQELSSLLNQFADRFDQLTSEREQEISQARIELEDERNILIALMAELTEGVIICNIDGQILLYNPQARNLLSQGSDANRSSNGFVGLGRSIFDLVNRDKLTFALEHLQPKASKAVIDPEQAFDVSTGFVTAVAQDRLLRLRLSPCRNHDRAFVGYIIILESVSAEIARMDQMLTSYDLLNEAAAGSVTGERSWRLEDMHVDDLLLALRTHIRARLGIEATIETTDDASLDASNGDTHNATNDLIRITQQHNQWLKIDTYAVLHSVTSALRDLHHNYGMTNAQFSAEKMGHLNQVALMLKFQAIFHKDAWSAWQSSAQQIDVRDATLTLNEVAAGHGGTLSFMATDLADDVASNVAADMNGVYAIQLHFPISQPLVQATVPLVVGSRPETYDFDLFAHRLPAAQMQQPLAALIYTVFDTETTGLNISHNNPATRDTIISIGALRIVNGRLLRQESFEQLVDPQRAIPPESTAIHGITPAMVANQPRLAQVLPAFHRYADETVLVAHNAAFDMRLLQLNEASTDVRFVNPVLDTLLLSTIVHPDQDDHALESIAARLGVRVTDRHTAWGDALTTAEVFLRLLPLLADMGITTLNEAIEVSKESYLARVQY